MNPQTRNKLIAALAVILAIVGVIRVVGFGLERNSVDHYLGNDRKSEMFEAMEGWSQDQVGQYYLDAVTRIGEEVAEKYHLEPDEGENTAPQLSSGVNCRSQRGFTKEFVISDVSVNSQMYMAAPAEDWPAIRALVRERMAELGYTTEVVAVDEPGNQSIDFYDEEHGATAYLLHGTRFFVSIDSPCIRMSHEGIDVPDEYK